MDVSASLARLLVLAVIFVNGWTDAPNAIATAVGSGAISFRRGAALAAVYYLRFYEKCERKGGPHGDADAAAR